MVHFNYQNIFNSSNLYNRKSNIYRRRIKEIYIYIYEIEYLERRKRL